MPAEHSLANEVRVGREIVDQIQATGIDADDPDLPTLLESETGILDRLRRMLRAARQSEAQAKALGEMIAEMQARKARLTKKAGGLRAVVLWALGELGMRRLDAPDLTATVAPGRPKIIVTDPDALPDIYCRITREPDKTALGDALKAGAVIAGVELSNPAPSLTVRVQ